MKRLFIVDDDPSILEIMSMVLRPSYDINCFLSCLDCLSQTEHCPDLIFLDNLMKDCIGIKMIPDLKQKFPKTKIVLMSGNLLLQNAKDIPGIDLFVEKPFDLENLLLITNKLLIEEPVTLSQ